MLHFLVTFRLACPANVLDIELCLTSGQTFRWKRHRERWELWDGPHRFVIEQDSSGVEVETNAGRAEFEFLFDLDRDYEALRAEIVGRAPELTAAVAPLSGLRMMRQADPVEVLFVFLCTQNNHLPRIHSLVDKLVGFGSSGEFPTLEVLASISEGELRGLGFGYRGATIPLAARQVLARGGRSWLEELRSGSYTDAHSALISLPGVGPKVADCLCLYGLHHGCAVPIDVHVWRAAVEHYFPDLAEKAVTPQRYRRVAEFMRERFGDLAGHAQQMLFVDRLTGKDRRVRRTK